MSGARRLLRKKDDVDRASHETKSPPSPETEWASGDHGILSNNVNKIPKISRSVHMNTITPANARASMMEIVGIIR